MRKCTLFFMVIFLFVIQSCSDSSNAETEKSLSSSVSIMNWNLETFFDAVFDGNEYSDFSNAKKGWSKEKYQVRLERLANVVKTLDCDVLVMEELEKEEQLYDITNQLADSFDSKKLYKYGFFASEKGSSIGCGILSRFPIKDVSVHTIEISENQPSMRPIIELTLDVNGKKLVVFVNHWKSKSGGEAESEIYRDKQEMLLSRLIKKASVENPILACGDFNRSIQEFEYKKNGEYNIVLKGGTNVYSPWFDVDGNLSKTGSYWYNENWEYIDNFFASGNAKIENFKAQSKGEWAYEDGHPNRYKLYNGKGYSDHLPITCEVKF